MWTWVVRIDTFHIQANVSGLDIMFTLCCIWCCLQCFWCCWLGGRKGIQPVKKLSLGVLRWLSVCGEVQICIWPSWCHCHSLSCFSKIQTGYTFLVLAYPGSPRQKPLNRCCCCCCVPLVSSVPQNEMVVLAGNMNGHVGCTLCPKKVSPLNILQ